MGTRFRYSANRDLFHDFFSTVKSLNAGVVNKGLLRKRMDGSMLCPNLGVRTATGFYRFSVLGSAEGERWQAGPRSHPPSRFFLPPF